MRSSENIEHEGIIESIESSIVNVRIVSESACSSCHAKGACSAADLQDKLIEVEVDIQDDYTTGQKVVIVGKAEQGLKASLYAYIIPTALVLISMIITYQITGKDILAGIVSLGILVPYFTIVSLTKKKFKKTFSFRLKPF